MRAYLAGSAGLLSFLALLTAAPAEAHHPGVAGSSGSGGGINTISADTLTEGMIAASIRYEFVRLGQLSDADLLAGMKHGQHAHAIGSIDSLAISAAYGITEDLTMSVRVAGVRRSDIRQGSDDTLVGGHMRGMSASDMGGLMSPDSITHRGNSLGFGDTTLLGQYRFYNNVQSGLSAAVLFGFKAPTGSTSRRDSAGALFEAELQPGSGSWDGLLGAALTKRLGRWSVDVSGLYVLAGTGTQQTNLGDRFLFGTALSYRLVGASGSSKDIELHDYCMKPQNQLQEHCLYHANHDHSEMMKTPYTVDLVLELNGEWHDKQRIAGVPDPNSGGTTVYLSPGVRVGVDRFSSFLSVGVPILNQTYGIQSKADYRILTGFGARLN
jgi:hypothetical protein